MTVALELLSNALLLLGVLALLTGAVGLHRMPDFYTRTHAASVIDTAGVALVLAALLLRCETWATAIRLLLIGLFLFFTSPTATHALAQSALQDGLRPIQRARKP